MVSAVTYSQHLYGRYFTEESLSTYIFTKAFHSYLSYTQTIFTFLPELET